MLALTGRHALAASPLPTWSQPGTDSSGPGDAMLALTGLHEDAASLWDLDSTFQECGVASSSHYTPNHLSGGATRQSDLGGLPPSSSCEILSSPDTDYSVLGADWDLP
jgi:hypothetical protein